MLVIQKIGLGFADHLFPLLGALLVGTVVAMLFWEGSKIAKVSAFAFGLLFTVSLGVWWTYSSLIQDMFFSFQYRTGGIEKMKDSFDEMDTLRAATLKHALLPMVVFSALSLVVIWIPRMWQKFLFSGAFLTALFFITGNFHVWLSKVANLIPIFGPEALLGP